MALIKRFSVFLLLTSMGCKPSAGPIPYYKSKILNVGIVKVNREFQGSFKLYNKGDGPLEIKSILSDCECTVIKDFAKVIQPKDSSTIKYTFHPNVIGYDHQNFFINNNSKVESTIMVAVRAKVEL
jgi:hypothetical protein